MSKFDLFLIIMAVWVLISIADFVRAIIWQHKIKKHNLRADFRHAESLEAWAKVEAALKNAQISIVEFNSIKRWLRANMDQMNKLSDKLDEANKMAKTTYLTVNTQVDGDKFDLEKIAKEIDKNVGKFGA